MSTTTTEPLPDSQTTTAPPPLDEEFLGPSIAIIGAGVNGLAFAIKLIRKFGYTNFIIYEKASDLGGTWRDCVYPGASSDVSMPFYSLSTDLHNWPSSHGSQPQIHTYWSNLATRYSLHNEIRFNSSVVSAEWDASELMYKLVVEDTRDGKRREVWVNLVVSAVGVLEAPRVEGFVGLERFKGDYWHSARWRKDVDLKGKRVGVIGNGPSATQFIPKITEDPSVEVINFCRTPNWFLPDLRTSYTPTRRWISHNIPFAKRFFRWSVFFRAEMFYFLVFSNAFMRKISTAQATSYILKKAPKKYQKELVPTFPMGCKRVIFDTNYLGALHRPNLDLNWDGIKEVVEDGVITKTGEKIPLDVLIFATGYSADKYLLPIRGITETIQEYYTREGGAKAYLGTMVPGFPNFFTIYGPNTNTGHTSVVYTGECQIDLILQLIAPMTINRFFTIEVKKEPTDAYNKLIHSRLDKSVFTQCASWYRVGGEGKVSNIFPGSGTEFYLRTRKPNWEHFTGVGADKFIERRMRKRYLYKWLVLSILALVVSFFVRAPDEWAKVVAWFWGVMEALLEMVASIRTKASAAFGEL